MENNEKGKTILHFIFVNDDKATLGQYFREVFLNNAKISFYLGDNKESNDEWDSEDENIIKNFNVDTSKSNDIKFDIELNENSVYYHEKIQLFPIKEADIKTITLEYPIYKDKINNVYIDELNDKKNIRIILSH